MKSMFSFAVVIASLALAVDVQANCGNCGPKDASGEKECHCPVEAAKIAKDSGKEKLFVVGEEKTHCEQTARLNLARAKYKAAIEAMVKAQADAAKPEADTET